MRKYIVMLGNSIEGIRAAKKLGYNIILIRDYEDSDFVEPVEEIYLVESITQSHEIIQILKNTNKIDEIDLVISFTERGLISAAEVSKELNLETNEINTIESTRNKISMRSIFNSFIDLRVDFSQGMINEFCVDKPPIKFPFIIKPYDGFGSNSVSLITEKNIWKKWLEINKSDLKTMWIVEQFINGSEFSVEAVSCNGKHHIIGLTKKLLSDDGKFIEVGHTVYEAEVNERKEIEQLIVTALNTMKVKYGPSHIEIKYDEDLKKYFIIEMHTRPGGDSIPKIHYLQNGINQYEYAIQSFLHTDLVIDKKITGSEVIGIRFINLKKGKLKNLGIKGDIPDNILEWNIKYKLEEEIIDPNNSSSRAGYVIIKDGNENDLDDTFQRFIKLLDYKVE